MNNNYREWLGWLRSLVNVWVIVGTALVGISLLCLTLAAAWYSKPPQAEPSPATAVLNLIAMPSATPTVSIPTPAPPTPTATTPPGSGGSFAIGSSVQISGTSGDGLRLRSAPGLQSEVLFLAFEGEIFTVEDGPRSADGYDWFSLVAPYDPNIRGWAAANFLQSVPPP